MTGRTPRGKHASPQSPVFSVLEPEESRALLGRNHIGRLAFTADHRIDIEPVSYAAEGDWIFIRSAHGAKLEALAHMPYAAFEVEEVDGPFDWESVVAHGTVYVMSDHGSRVDRSGFQRALAALRSFAPQTLLADDPTPFRDTIYGLHISQITGRRAGRRASKASRTLLTGSEPATRARRTPDGF